MKICVGILLPVKMEKDDLDLLSYLKEPKKKKGRYMLQMAWGWVGIS
jgi:hypothetical protein